MHMGKAEKKEEISDFEVRATISYKGQTASGIFTFNEQYEMISFTTNDRAVAGTDGIMEYIPWSAICNDYQLSHLLPKMFCFAKKICKQSSQKRSTDL